MTAMRVSTACVHLEDVPSSVELRWRAAGRELAQSVKAMDKRRNRLAKAESVLAAHGDRTTGARAGNRGFPRRQPRHEGSGHEGVPLVPPTCPYRVLQMTMILRT